MIQSLAASRWHVVGLVWLVAATARTHAADFALRDGDTVVFLGDSITAARTYSRIIENYTLLRFPDRRIHFINRGHGGETAAKALERLDRDVFGNGATVLIVAYGVNDIGWGLHADEEHKQLYLQGVRTIVERCREHNVRVYICSAAITGADPAKTENDFLQQMCDEGMSLSRDLGEHSIDVQRTMRGIQKRVWEHNPKVDDESKQVKLHAADGVHLNDLGQLAMAYAILKGLDAPADVSSATVNAHTAEVASAEGCRISDVVRDGDRLEFTRLDAGLPFNNGLFYALNYAWVPVPSELARYMLTVTGLPAGRYLVTADGRGVGHYSAQQLATGINMAFATTNAWEPGGPWDAQASLLKLVTESKDNAQTAEYLAHLYDGNVRPDAKFSAETNKAVADLEALQRTIATPRVYRFVIAPAAAETRQ
jgi:lysophospholipase L1-like esterase